MFKPTNSEACSTSVMTDDDSKAKSALKRQFNIQLRKDYMSPYSCCNISLRFQTLLTHDSPHSYNNKS